MQLYKMKKNKQKKKEKERGENIPNPFRKKLQNNPAKKFTNFERTFPSTKKYLNNVRAWMRKEMVKMTLMQVLHHFRGRQAIDSIFYYKIQSRPKRYK